MDEVFFVWDNVTHGDRLIHLLVRQGGELLFHVAECGASVGHQGGINAPEATLEKYFGQYPIEIGSLCKECFGLTAYS